MKRLLFIIFLVNNISSFGQKILVNVKPDSVYFRENGSLLNPPCRLKPLNPLMVYTAVKQGYVTQGFVFSELLKTITLDEKGHGTYNITLEKIRTLPSDYSSKAINAYKVTDKTGRIIEFNFSDPFFTEELTKRMMSFGYTNVTNRDVFDQTQAQLQIAGEIIEYSRNTIGPRFQVSIIVKWSVYDMTENKVVLQSTTAGFSDTNSRFKNELGYALRNALTGLLSNEAFQELAKR